jgi:hypothetical protein
MLPGLNRIGLLALCLLPALVFDAHVPGSLAAATYISACGGTGQSPTVRTSYVTAHRPARRPKSALVEFFEGEAKPARAYEPVGSVLVLAHVSGTGPGELADRAKAAARAMGGDALVNVHIDDAASLRPPAGPVGRLALRAAVVRWTEQANAVPQ